MSSPQALEAVGVLVLEDDFYLAEDARRTLEEAGATVIGPFSDADEAIAAAEREKPSCALVDINLGDGPDFAPAKALIARGISIIFVTGYDAAVIPPELAAVPCLQKPVEPRHILDAIQSLSLH
ncbi:MAG: response regulator [Phenylobacterium sp.]|uniref:response regulator n=1 Tax=Phenylobacterium sp. TaxID=1871053 RepID=UPI003919D0A0